MPTHVVVDGSNLATEGRALPSLKQLNEAVLAYMEENPKDVITVVVDATFGHRIDPREVAEFDAAVENNELVAPPAGAIGRGDAFVLTIANKVKATVISNDSYQEFHGTYDWLFDEGRLVGGKPVPNVGGCSCPACPGTGADQPTGRQGLGSGEEPVEPAKPRRGHGPGQQGGVASRCRCRRRRRRARSARSRRLAPPAAKAATTPATPGPADQTDAPTATRPHMVERAAAVPRASSRSTPSGRPYRRGRVVLQPRRLRHDR